MTVPPRFVIYSDLDGCLLDRESYRFDEAQPALELLRRHGIPLVLCSSKTQAEVAHHREILGLAHPFIVENGGALLIPEGYFPFPHAFTRSAGRYCLVEFGVAYALLAEALHEIQRATGLRLRGFSEMSVEEVASLTGLSREAASRAQARHYDEPFVADLTREEAERLDFEARRKGLTLTRLYRSGFSRLTTVGLGDGPNDLSMLERVDVPVVIPRAPSLVDPAFEGRPWTVAPAPGPAGWALAILAFLKNEPRQALEVT